MEKLGLSSRAIIGRFYQTLEAALRRSWASQIGMPFSSDQESETYKWLGMSPALREWINGRQAKGLRSSGFTIANKTFEATLALAVDDLRRDKTGQIQVRIDEMAARTASHWEKLLSGLILDGDSNVCYDGEEFFDTTHSEGDSGTLLNLVAAAQIPALNIADADAPTADEMADAILGVIAWFYGFLDDQGEPINGDAKNFLVMAPLNIWAPAVAAVASNMLNTGAGSRDNPLLALTQNQGLVVNVVPNPRLDWTTDFAVFRTDGRAKPFILQEELEVQVSAIAEGSEEEFINDRHLYGIKAIRNAGYGLWQHAIRATLSHS
jgi:phage major head subunit gpT-like protein